MLTSSFGLLSIMFGVSQVNKLGLSSPVVHLLIVFGIVCLIVFILVERKAANPVVDLSLFKNRVFSAAIWSLFLTFVAYPVFVLVMPFYLMQGIGLPPSRTGMLMAVVSMTTIIVGPVSGWLSDRSQPVWISTMGAIATLVAYLLMCRFDLQTQIVGIVPVFILYGLGVSAFHAPNNSSIMGSVRNEHVGTASALIATQRQVGMSLGMAIAGTVYTARKARHLTELTGKGLGAVDAARKAIPLSFHDALLVSACILSFVVLLCLATWNRNKE
jgi:Na+/melibiose symporter-like transporter